MGELRQFSHVLLHRCEVIDRPLLERDLAALLADRPNDRSTGEEGMRSFALDDGAVGDAGAQEVVFAKGGGEVPCVVDSRPARHDQPHSTGNASKPQSPFWAVGAAAVAALLVAAGAAHASGPPSAATCLHAPTMTAFRCVQGAVAYSLRARFAATLGSPAANLQTRFPVCNGPFAPTRIACSFRTQIITTGPATYVEGFVSARFVRALHGYRRVSFAVSQLRCLKDGQPVSC